MYQGVVTKARSTAGPTTPFAYRICGARFRDAAAARDGRAVPDGHHVSSPGVDRDVFFSALLYDSLCLLGAFARRWRASWRGFWGGARWFVAAVLTGSC